MTDNTNSASATPAKTTHGAFSRLADVVRAIVARSGMTALDRDALNNQVDTAVASHAQATGEPVPTSAENDADQAAATTAAGSLTDLTNSAITAVGATATNAADVLAAKDAGAFAGPVETAASALVDAAEGVAQKAVDGLLASLLSRL